MALPGSHRPPCTGTFLHHRRSSRAMDTGHLVVQAAWFAFDSRRMSFLFRAWPSAGTQTSPRINPRSSKRWS